ncbi:hypothetical protein BKA70DRAFT_1525632 [Coprinopsis sp. MPI-PUGE-AT-0042]|nr:hypothetical protein BKA70DRAFT_1525632 [Coprinopsis sp. MPI-PUGE-AT-0042]
MAATARRSWKTLRGKPEVVWPAALDAALVEAVEEYRKMEAQLTTGSNYGVQYPMRNRFICDYIFKTTGETRTAKQVGSRLQQLGATSEDSRLSNLLGGFQRSNGPTPPPEETMVIHVQLEFPSEPQGVSSLPTSTPQVHLTPNDMDTPHYLYLMPLSRHWSDPSPPAHPTPSLTLSSFSSFVELVSPFPLSEDTTWSVYRDNALVHQERTELSRVTSPLPGAADRRVYVCDLVPSLWPILCESEDPNYITIVQKVRSTRESSSLPVKEASIVYHFNVPDYTKLRLRPAAPSYNVDTARHRYSLPSSLTSPKGFYPSFPNYGSSLQGYTSWPSSSQDYYSYQDAGYYPGHRRMHNHDPSLVAADPTQSIGGRRYAVNRSPGQEGDVESDVSPHLFPTKSRTQWDTNAHGAISLLKSPFACAAGSGCCRHNHSLSLDGLSVFGRCTNIAVNYCHITSQTDVRPPAAASDIPQSYIPGPTDSNVVQERPDLRRPPTLYSSTGAAVHGRRRSGPSLTTPSPSPPPTAPPTAPGWHTAAIAAIFVMMACLVLW